MSEFDTRHLELSPEARLDQNLAVLSREFVDRDFVELQAWDLIARHEVYEWEHLPSEDYNNAVTSLFEELRAAGDLSELDFKGDQAEIHAATIARLLNGYHTPTPEWEKSRRFAEICEELTIFQIYCMIDRGEIPKDTKCVVVSDFPDDAENIEEAHSIGYRGRNRKGMVRVYLFNQDENGVWTRHIEQLSRSNADTSNSTRDWFNKNATAVPLNSTGALSEQFLMSAERLPDGVVSMMEELDSSGDETTLYGESFAEAATRGRPGYNRVRVTSLVDRQKEHKFIRELEDEEARLTSLLQSGEISYDKKLFLFHKKQNEIVERITLQAPQKYAYDARGAKTVEYYMMANQAAAVGDMYAFNMHIQFARGARDKLAGGSCGSSGADQKDSGPEIPGDIKNLYEKFESDAESRSESSWDWKDGYCRVEQCDNKGKKTEVGPCDVCKDCQKKFDRDNNWAEKISATPGKIILESLFSTFLGKGKKGAKTILAITGISNEKVNT